MDIRTLLFQLGQFRLGSRGLTLVDGSGAAVASLEVSSGAPEGAVTAKAGSLCLDITNGALHIKAVGAGATGWSSVADVTGSGLVVPHQSGNGIKVNQSTPTYPWRDIIGAVQPKASGAGSPTRRIYRGGEVGVFSFAANDVCDFCFHIPHDYVPGSDLLFHVHWSHNGTSISGNAVFDFYYTYAKRTSGMVFPAEKMITVSVSTPNVATIPQYSHRVDETALTAADATATLTDRDLIEVDGLIEGTIKLRTLPTIGSGFLFIHTCDIHYQSTNMGTVSSAPDYYTPA